MTLKMAWLVSFIGSKTYPKVVLEMCTYVGATALSISFYAIFTNDNYSVTGPKYYILSSNIVVFIMFILIFGFHIGLLVSLVLIDLISLYLLYDMRTILDSKSQNYVYDENMYILASVNLYLDV